MRQSQLFTRTRKEAPKDEVSKNAILLTRAGFINKEMAGVYDLLPLGLRVMKKIENIIREEMNKIGGQEVEMSSLQRPELWKSHFNQDRWDDNNVDNWFKTKLKDGSELGLAFTHEEPISNMLEQFVSSYRDLPFSVYQFQKKFRNELRAKSGIMRGREFLMKDLYSFSRTQEEHEQFYERAKQAYINIFSRVGIGDMTYLTAASGGTFSKYSHEFQTVTEAGEDTIYVTDEAKKEAINKEISEDEKGEEKKAVEVGNIFTLGIKFSDPNLKFKDEEGENQYVFMGSYGIGLGRLMGTVAEVLSDENGLVWPKSIAPFNVHVIKIGDGEKVSERANHLVEELEKKAVTVLYDDRDLRAGEKFADADLIGIPYQIIVSERGNDESTVEVKERSSGDTQVLSEVELLNSKYADFLD